MAFEAPGCKYLLQQWRERLIEVGVEDGPSVRRGVRRALQRRAGSDGPSQQVS